jgi:pimeloyl-ACP methyl ester carboxylesterase
VLDRRIRLLIVALAVPGVVSAVPALRARAKAASLLAEVAELPFPRLFRGNIEIETVELAPGVVGDLYSRRLGAPTILFVPGAALKGREDARVIQTATALARAGRRVFVPELDLYHRTFRQNDIERIVSAVVELSSDHERVGVLGFSYGGSLALIAGKDQRARGRVAYFATFGAYFDLVHVVQGVTTGSTILDGEEVRFPTVPEAREILTTITRRLGSERHAAVLRRALDDEIETETPDDPDAIRDLLSNRDPRRTQDLAARLAPRFRDVLARFSPAAAIDELDAPLFILQSKKDAATPWTEAVLLHRAVDGSRLVLVEHFSHVDPPGLTSMLRDGPKAWWFASCVLSAQE